MKKSSRKKAGAVTRSAGTSHEDALFARVVDIIEAARGHVMRSVNTAMVQAYWLIGVRSWRSSSAVRSAPATARG